MTRGRRIVTLAGGVLIGLLPACTELPKQPPRVALREPVESAERSDEDAAVAVRSPYGGAWRAPTVETQLAARPTERRKIAARPEEPVAAIRPTFDASEMMLAQFEAPAPPKKAEAEPAKPPLIPTPENPKPALLPTGLRDESPLVAALRGYLEKHPDEARDLLRTYDRTNSDSLDCLLALAVKLEDGSLRDPGEVAAVVEQLQRLAESLRPKAALGLDNVCFCRRIHKFAAYEPLGDCPAMRPGELAEVYAELRNISCEKAARATDPEGEWGTRVTSAVVIRDAKGRTVWREDFVRNEAARTPRHDFYHHYRFAVPALPPGTYALHVEVTDVPTGRTAKRALDFRIAN